MIEGFGHVTSRICVSDDLLSVILCVLGESSGSGVKLECRKIPYECIRRD